MTSAPISSDPLDARTGLDAEARSERARAAAQARWARADAEDRAKVGMVLREVTLQRFEAEVDPEGTLSPNLRRALAEQAWHEHLRLKARLRWARWRALRDINDGEDT